MTKFQKTANTTLGLLVFLSLIFSYDGECSELTHMSRTGKKLFAPRFLINIGVDMLLAGAFARTNERITATEVAVLFFANSATPVLLFQNYHSVTPFLASIAFTGSAFIASELIGRKQLGEGYDLGLLRIATWWVVMPLIASKTNHIIYLKRYKKRQLELNLLKPTYLSYDNKIVAGVQLIKLNW